jgi:hypothetical protein
MRPIVDGLKKQYRSCMKVEIAHFHTQSHWSDLIGPIGTPEFALLDSSENILYRWVGFTEKDEFTPILDSFCTG